MDRTWKIKRESRELSYSSPWHQLKEKNKKGKRGKYEMRYPRDKETDKRKRKWRTLIDERYRETERERPKDSE